MAYEVGGHANMTKRAEEVQCLGTRDGPGETEWVHCVESQNKREYEREFGDKLVIEDDVFPPACRYSLSAQV